MYVEHSFDSAKRRKLGLGLGLAPTPATVRQSAKDPGSR
jgi:hypothetical protein